MAYGIKVFLDEDGNNALWVMDVNVRSKAGEDYPILQFDTSEEANRAAKNMLIPEDRYVVEEI